MPRLVVAVLIAWCFVVGMRGDGRGGIPAELPVETRMLEDRLLQTLRFGDRLEPAIRAIVRDEIARQVRALLAKDPRFLKSFAN